MPKEIWKPIPLWEGYYSVSNLGNVRSEKRIVTDSRTKSSYIIQEKLLKKYSDNSGKGYYRVSLSKNSKIKYVQIHRLVAWAFIGIQDKTMEVRHLDGNCKNNNVNNLAYGNRSQNIRDAINHGTFPLLEKRPSSKLTKEQVLWIANSKNSMKTLSSQFKVSLGTIRDIKTGKTWTSVTKEILSSKPYKYRKSPKK